MRIWVYISAALVLTACAGEVVQEESITDSVSEQEENVELSDHAKVEDNTEEGPDLTEQQVTPFFLENFPRKWILLTPMKEESEELLVIEHYCDAEIPFIELIPEKGDTWSVYIGYGQDGETGTLSNFEAVQDEVELYQCVSGTFDYLSEFGDAKAISFLWNQDLMFGSFEGFGFDESFFTREEDRTNYAEIKPDCSGFWE